MKHTPGPWYAHKTPDGISSAGFVISDSPDREPTYICETIPHQPNTGDEEANARLIAAAPELLEALERVLKSDLIARPGDAFEAFQLAEKAITKAKGQQ